MKPEVIKNGRGNVEHIKYTHRNAEKGCSYTLTTNEYVVAEMKAMRVDGTDAKV